MRLIPLMCETCNIAVVINRNTECFCRIHSRLNHKLRLKKQIILLFDRELRSTQQRSQNMSTPAEGEVVTLPLVAEYRGRGRDPAPGGGVQRERGRDPAPGGGVQRERS